MESLVFSDQVTTFFWTWKHPGARCTERGADVLNSARVELNSPHPDTTAGLCATVWAFEEEEDEEKKNVAEEERTVYNHTDWIAVKSLGPALTNTAAY